MRYTLPGALPGRSCSMRKRKSGETSSARNAFSMPKSKSVNAFDVGADGIGEVDSAQRNSGRRVLLVVAPNAILVQQRTRARGLRPGSIPRRSGNSNEG